MLYICFFFFKQKTAYELRISDWSSDVCSSDLFYRTPERKPEQAEHVKAQLKGHGPARHGNLPLVLAGGRLPAAAQDQLAPTIFQAWCRHGFSIGITDALFRPPVDRKSTRLNSSH